MKRLRDGTRSCAECRRRKNRCVFESNAQACLGCQSRGVRCIPQGIALDVSPSVHDHREAIEQQINQLLQSLQGETDLLVELRPKAQAIEALKSLQFGLVLGSGSGAASSTVTPYQSNILTPSHTPGPDHIHDSHSSQSTHGDNGIAPLTSMLDNVVLQRDCNTEAGRGSGSANVFSRGERRILQGLQAVRPNIDDMRSIFRTTSLGWSFWMKSFEPIQERWNGPIDDESFLQFISQSLTSSDASMQIKATICLATGIQQLPNSFRVSHGNLAACLEVLQEHHLIALDKLLSCDMFVSSLDGLECLSAMSQFYTDLGEPQKAWLMTRRAASMALFAGYHRLATTPDDNHFERKRTVWARIWQFDRFLSIVLGHPYCVPDEFLDTSIIISPIEKFLETYCLVAAKVIRMNQMPKIRTFEGTIKADEELLASTALLPPGFWSMAFSLSIPVDAALDVYRIQIGYLTIRNTLHLPFMLASFTNLRYRYSRVAAVESSRESMQIFRNSHQIQKSGIVCNAIYFEAFAAAFIVVLHLMATPLGLSEDPTQWVADWELINCVAKDLESIARKMTCTVAGQAANILGFFYGARNQWPDSMDGSGAARVELVIPYFGRARIWKGKSFLYESSREERGSIQNAEVWAQTLDYSLVADPPTFEMEDDISGHEFQFGSEPHIAFESFFQPVINENISWPDLMDTWTIIGISS